MTETWAQRSARMRAASERYKAHARAEAERLGIREGTAEAGPFYDVTIRILARRTISSRGARDRDRTERWLRWGGRIDATGAIEFYVRRPLPDGPEHSRYIDPTEILDVREVGSGGVRHFVGPTPI